jgi:hypothetical protein
VTGQHRLAILPEHSPEHSPGPPVRAPGRRLARWALGEGAGAVPWLLAGAALLYLALLLARFGHILSAVNWSSDAAFWPVLVDHLPPRGAGVTNLGNTPHYMTVLFLLATRALPGHWMIWAWSPLVTSLAGVGLVAWASHRAFGRRAGLLTLCVGTCASFPVIQTIVPQGVRSWTWVADAVMGALLVELVSLFLRDRHGRMALVRGGAATLVATVFAGLTIASDPLFLVAGLGPFAAAAGVVRLRHPGRASRRLVLAAALVVAGGFAVALPVAGAMASRGFRWSAVPNALAFASYDDLVRHLGWLGEALFPFGNGLFFSRPIGLVAVAMLVSSVLGLVALGVTATRAGWRLTGSDRSAAQTAHVAYWSLSAAFVVGVYVVSTIPTVSGIASSRYLVPVFYAVAALLPLCTGRSARSRMAATAAAGVFCVVGILSQNVLVVFDRGPFPQPRDGRQLIAFLEHEGLTRGYAGYWDSHSVTWHSWHSGGRATIYPVSECLPLSKTLCPVNLATSTSWYRPEPAVKTFVVTGGSGPPGAALRTSPPESFGPPAQTATVGAYSVFVYDYDVASRFGPMPPPP